MNKSNNQDEEVKEIKDITDITDTNDTKDIIDTNDTNDTKDIKDNTDNTEDKLENFISETNNLDYLEPSKNITINDSNSNVENNSFKYLINSLETIECNNDGSIELNNLDSFAENTEPIELKTHETIYLEIYKKAKQKAKEIRNNAIEAFLEAKNIKMKYNLNTILDDSSSDEENELLNIN